MFMRKSKYEWYLEMYKMSGMSMLCFSKEKNNHRPMFMGSFTENMVTYLYGMLLFFQYNINI